MGWYSALIIFDDSLPDRPAIREESVRIFRASTQSVAWETAQKVGKENEHSYLNDQEETVTWKFIEVSEVQDLCEEELFDGVEVFSRLVRT